MGRLTGKRALITAAGQGIGRASAIAMANEGAQVIATDVNAEALASLHHDNIATRIFERARSGVNRGGCGGGRPSECAVQLRGICGGGQHPGL